MILHYFLRSAFYVLFFIFYELFVKTASNKSNSDLRFYVSSECLFQAGEIRSCYTIRGGFFLSARVMENVICNICNHWMKVPVVDNKDKMIPKNFKENTFHEFMPELSVFNFQVFLRNFNFSPVYMTFYCSFIS